MQLSHTPGRMSASFDEPNLVGSAGLVPAMMLAGRIGLVQVADELLTVPGAKGCAGTKLTSVLAGMLAGADSIDDLDVLNTELASWQSATNDVQRQVDWQFTADDARIKLRHLYPNT